MKNRNPTLPPKLTSKAVKAVLEVRVESLISTSTPQEENSQQQIKYVKLQWWGMNAVEKLPIGTGLTAKYDIVTDRFRDYLKDACRLYIEALNVNEETIGFAVIERLERIVDYGGISTDEVQVFNEKGQIKGNLRCIFMFEECASKRKVTFNDMEDEETMEDQHDYDEVAVDQESSPEVAVLPSQKNHLPTWNLSTDRLKYLSRVKSLSVFVKQVTLNPAVVQHLDTFNLSKPSRTKPSFLINYQLPNENNTITMCASKQPRTRLTRTNDNVLHFEARAEHFLRFNTQVLDSWWISKLTLQLFMRHLGQRVPVPIGDITIGLKHLLINSKYSDSEMKLPIYASNRLHKHLEKHYPEEIIGDLSLNFSFKCNEQQPTMKVEIKSKPVTEAKPILETKPKGRQLVNAESPKKPSTLLLCLLKVNEGRGFTKGSQLYLACRFFSTTEKVSSSIHYSTDTRPKFEFQHIAKMGLDSGLDLTCKDNHLVIEVWNYNEPHSELVGVATVPLHQLYTAFQDPVIKDTQIKADLPFVAFNDWFSVRDVLDSGKIKGEIKVMLACGLGKQIYNLTMKPEDGEDSEKPVVSKDNIPTPVEVEPTTVPFQITVSEGRNLPQIGQQDRESPVTYVTLECNGKTYTSDICWKTCQPTWGMSEQVHLPVQMLQDKRHQLIIKVWHHRQSQDVDQTYDYVLGFAAIDVSLILHDSFTEVSGWYNLMDYMTRCRGQIKVHLRPLENVQSLRQRIGSPILNEPKPVEEEKKGVSSRAKPFWNPPTIAQDLDDSKSTLQIRLKELDCIAKRLQTKANLEITKNNEEKDAQELEKLRHRLESQLEIMQNIVKQSSTKEADEADDATYDISEASSEHDISRMAPDGGNPTTEPDIPTRDRPTRS